MAFNLKIYHRFAEYDVENKLSEKSVTMLCDLFGKRQNEIPDGATVYLNVNGLSNNIESLYIGIDKVMKKIAL